MKQRTRLMHGLNAGDDLLNYQLSKKTDGDTNGEIQLHKMKGPEHFLEAQVQEGDTVQAIALKFHCPISELKRINHIHKDNEIFARRTLKIPVTPYSVLTELIPTSQTVNHVATTSVTLETPPADLINTQSHVPIMDSNSETKNELTIDCNAVVMNSILAPSVIPYSDADPSEPVSEDTQLLPNKPREPVESVVVKQLTSQGADFGLKWFHLLGCLLILGVIIPIVYVVFYLPKHELHTVPPLSK